jgi:hypothetical protein
MPPKKGLTLEVRLVTPTPPSASHSHFLYIIDLYLLIVYPCRRSGSVFLLFSTILAMSLSSRYVLREKKVEIAGQGGI